jgi:S1-C subfamily serine protease
MALPALLLAGCAGILNKGNHSMVISSEPSGATLYLNGSARGTTPYTYVYALEEGEDLQFEVRMTGYLPTTLSVRPGRSEGVLFADAMLLGIPYIVDSRSPDLYKLPVKEVVLHLYKEQREDLARYAVPVTELQLDLGDKPVYGTYQKKPITLKDATFRDLKYVETLTSSLTGGFKNTWMDARTVRVGTSRGDEAIQRAKFFLRPVLRSVRGDLTGQTNRCNGTVDLVIDWNFMSSTARDSMLFSTTTRTTYRAYHASHSAVLSEAVTHAARLLTEDLELHKRLGAAYGAGLVLSKGSSIMLNQPKPIAFQGRKDMISALVKAVVTIQTERGHGSGFLVTNDGYLITNEHVVRDENRVRVKFEQGFTMDAEVLKVNKDHDLALLKVNATDLPALLIGNDSELLLGEEIFAIGTPLDATLGQSVTRGVLSGRRELDGFQFLQTDVSINPGNSGGPLLDETGKVVGVATMKISGKGFEGLGFGIPISKALEMLNVTFQ